MDAPTFGTFNIPVELTNDVAHIDNLVIRKDDINSDFKAIVFDDKNTFEFYLADELDVNPENNLGAIIKYDIGIAVLYLNHSTYNDIDETAKIHNKWEGVDELITPSIVLADNIEIYPNSIIPVGTYNLVNGSIRLVNDFANHRLKDEIDDSVIISIVDMETGAEHFNAGAISFSKTGTYVITFGTRDYNRLKKVENNKLRFRPWSEYVFHVVGE